MPQNGHKIFTSLGTPDSAPGCDRAESILSPPAWVAVGLPLPLERAPTCRHPSPGRRLRREPVAAVTRGRCGGGVTAY